jgi:hypothetical protein
MAKGRKSMARATDATRQLGTAGGAAAGAAAGSLFGPLGAAVGALVGGVAGATVSEKPAGRRPTKSKRKHAVLAKATTRPSKKTSSKQSSAARKRVTRKKG